MTSSTFHLRNAVAVAALFLAALPASAWAQETSGLLDSFQAGPYVAATTGTGATFEYGVRAGMRSGPVRWDARASFIPIRSWLGCNPESPYCRDTAVFEVLAGAARAIGSSPDAPTLGWRAGLGHSTRHSAPRIMGITGPHLSLGLPAARQVGVRAEAGGLLYLASGELPGARAYVSLGLQARR